MNIYWLEWVMEMHLNPKDLALAKTHLRAGGRSRESLCYLSICFHNAKIYDAQFWKPLKVDRLTWDVSDSKVSYPIGFTKEQEGHK